MFNRAHRADGAAGARRSGSSICLVGWLRKRLLRLSNACGWLTLRGKANLCASVRRESGIRNDESRRFVDR
jgi:hypothetical protein